MPDHLILRIEAPLFAFGREAIDAYGVVQDFPASSMLTGLIANALGWRRVDFDCLNRLQERLVFGVRLDRRGVALRDFQTAQLDRSDRGWTTRGRPEGRAGGEGTYVGPHIRWRDYHADACVCVALRLKPPGEAPTLDDVETALDAPSRPLFIGRKPCIPSVRLIEGRCTAATVLDALARHPRLAMPAVTEESEAIVFWPEGEGTLERMRVFFVTDRRDWRSGVHGGARRMCEGTLEPNEAAT